MWKCELCHKKFDDEVMAIEVRFGKHKIDLSSRTLSDVIEKHTIDYMIDYFGKDKVQFKNWRGYDVIILLLEETIYVNFAKVAGSLSELDLLYYTKGEKPLCRLRTEFNGTHCHLRNEFYE